MPQKSSLKLQQSVAAPAEEVYNAWLNPEMAAKFLFKTETGEMVKVNIDGRVGGRFNITERRNGENIEHSGQYLIVERYKRLVFTFGVPKFSREMTKVTVDVQPNGKGCELTLTQENVLPEWAEKSKEGWSKILHGLAKLF